MPVHKPPAIHSTSLRLLCGTRAQLFQRNPCTRAQLLHLLAAAPSSSHSRRCRRRWTVAGSALRARSPRPAVLAARVWPSCRGLRSLLQPTPPSSPLSDERCGRCFNRISKCETDMDRRTPNHRTDSIVSESESPNSENHRTDSLIEHLSEPLFVLFRRGRSRSPRSVEPRIPPPETPADVMPAFVLRMSRPPADFAFRGAGAGLASFQEVAEGGAHRWTQVECEPAGAAVAAMLGGGAAALAAVVAVGLCGSSRRARAVRC